MTDVVVAILLLAAAAVPLLMLRDLRTLPTAPAVAAGASSVAVVIPARNEEASLPGVLASLQRLTVRPPEVVVVDDGSSDATAELARAAGARVLPAGAPPPGWTGKAWACHLGASATSGDLLLFLDADTALTPTALSSLLAARDAHGGLVSVQPFHRPERTYEQLSSYFNAVAVLASGAFAAGGPRGSIAFGPCLLTSRADYLTAGGHEAVRAAILDDASLAAAYSAAGLPVWCAVGGRSVSMRSYPGGWRQLVAGWTKNFASGAAAADPLAALASVLWISAHHATAVGAVLATLGMLTDGGGLPAAGPPVLWLAAWVLAAWQLRGVLRRIGSFRWWTWALFPLPLLAFDLIFARSIALTAVRRSVRWRDREVDLRRGRSTDGLA